MYSSHISDRTVKAVYLQLDFCSDKISQNDFYKKIYSVNRPQTSAYNFWYPKKIFSCTQQIIDSLTLLTYDIRICRCFIYIDHSLKPKEQFVIVTVHLENFVKCIIEKDTFSLPVPVKMIAKEIQNNTVLRNKSQYILEGWRSRHSIIFH